MASDVVRTRESKAQQALQSFWPNVMEEIQNLSLDCFREPQELPLARIKKIMKMDDDVRLVSAEVPMMFAKAAEIFITELTLRAWIHTEDNRRRTMQRSDIAMAITKFDQFDFLIDIVPQYERKPHKQQGQPRQSAEQAQYLFNLGQQPGAVPGHGQQHGAVPSHHGQPQGQHANTPAAATVQPGQVIIGQHLQVQVPSQGTPITSAPVGEGQQYQNIPMPLNTMQHQLGPLHYLRLGQPGLVGRGQIQKPASTTQQITQTQGQHFWQNYSSPTDSSYVRPSP